MSPVAATLGALILGEPNSKGLGSAVLVGAVVTLAMVAASARAHLSTHLPLVRSVYFLVGPALAASGLLFLKLTSAVPGLTPQEVIALAVLAAFSRVLLLPPSGLLGCTSRGARIGVVGSSRISGILAEELVAKGEHRLRVVGHIIETGVDHDATEDENDPIPLLGQIDELATIVARHDLELLLMSNEISRLVFFAEVADLCLASSVRVMELSAFYECVFGHVALTEINAAWFQYILHPRYASETSLSKRLVDIFVAGWAAVLLAPVAIILAFLVRRDGGPALYRQVRIGECGRPFTIFKLRSMRVPSSGIGASWCIQDDDRVTRMGRFMRRTHLDEVPQLINVLRGQMSIVGPRPEQPVVVERLERTIPFYTRRHLIRPGMTGWAQVQCGYAGTEAGSALKVCHDLYYIKHRSVLLDICIAVETLRTLVADRQWPGQPARRAFIGVYQATDAMSKWSPRAEI